MKYCGCKSCKDRGEVNPHEEFEKYLEIKEEWVEKQFEKIFLNSYTEGEMTDLYEELEPQFNSEVVNRINQYSDKPFDAHGYWLSYGGSLSAFERMQKGIELNGH